MVCVLISLAAAVVAANPATPAYPAAQQVDVDPTYQLVAEPRAEIASAPVPYKAAAPPAAAYKPAAAPAYKAPAYKSPEPVYEVII